MLPPIKLVASPPARSAARRYVVVCSACHSADVVRDASAVFDTATQSWVLGAVFDAGYCNACDSDRSLEELSEDASQVLSRAAYEAAYGTDPSNADAGKDAWYVTAKPNTIGFASQGEAIAWQRRYRKRAGLDPDTGLVPEAD